MVMPELTGYLAAQGIGVQALNLWYGMMPEKDATDGSITVTMMAYGGLDDEPVMGGTTISLEFPRIQMSTRGLKDDFDGPWLKMINVRTAFAKIGTLAISGIQYKAVMALGNQRFLRRDANFRVEIVCNFQVWKDYSPS